MAEGDRGTNNYVRFRRFVRNMRGHSSSKLIVCCDERHYVAKTVDNPMGRRTLVNEWVVARLFQSLGISTPDPRIVLSCSNNGGGNSHSSCESHNSLVAGQHFGSPLPVDPNVSAIYDFLPAKLYERLVNREDFSKVFVLDTLMGKPDPRQAIFFRVNTGEARYVAEFVDHGECFAQIQQCPLDQPCFYFDKRVYQEQISLPFIDEFLEQIYSLELDQLMNFLEEVPAGWLPAGKDEFQISFLAMLHRRSLLSSSTIASLLQGRRPISEKDSSAPLSRISSGGVPLLWNPEELSANFCV